MQEHGRGARATNSHPMGSISFEPLIPPSLWLALAAGAVALLGWYALRRPDAVGRARWVAVTGLMTASVAAGLVILLNPTWVREIPPLPGKPLLTVLVDSSASMATVDAAGRARYAAAADSAAALSDELQDRFDVRVRTFTDAPVAADARDLAARKPAGMTTDLASAVSAALAEDRPAGQAVVLLSDGIHNAGGGAAAVLDAARHARAVAAPVFTRTLGSDAGGLDLRVEMRTTQDLAFIGQRVAVSARVAQVGVSGGRANVSLLGADGVEVAREPVDLSPEIPSEVTFWIKGEKPGVFPYEVRVEPLPGELTQANNVAPYLLRVVDQPVRVLQLDGKPYWDSKFLLRTLAAVPAVELDSVVRIGDGRFMKRTIRRAAGAAAATAPAGAAATTDVPATASGVPAARAAAKRDEKQQDWKIVTSAAEVLGDAEALKRYQIIVLGRDAEPFLTDDAVARLQQWVARDGGALVCYRGSPTVQANEKLAKLLPVKWSPGRETRFRLKLTDDGRGMRWLGGTGGGAEANAGAAAVAASRLAPDADQAALAGLPTLATSAHVDKAKPLAVVLANAVSQGDGSGGAAAPPSGTSPATGGAPAVVYQPYGGGRVVVVEGAGMWRWAFLPPQYRQQEEVYASLWHSMLRWLISADTLVPGQKLALRSDQVAFDTTEPATATLILRDEGGRGKVPAVEVVPEGAGGKAAGKPLQFAPAPLGEEPGTFRVNFGKLPEGRYAARVVDAPADEAFARTVFSVRTVGEEQLNLKPRPDLMARLASDSGGAVLENADAGEVAGRFKEHMNRLRPPRLERSTAWDRWWVLGAVFALWAGSWVLRRSSGLV